MTKLRFTLPLGLAAVVALPLLPAWGGAQEGGGVTKPGCYISTGDNDWLWESPPTQSPADIQAFFAALRKVFGCDRIYWRGFQSELIVNHFEIRPQNFTGSGFWEWERHLVSEVGTSKAAVATAHALGMEIWGFTGLFEHGAAAESDAAKGSGPSPIEDRLRIDHPEWVPVDRRGLRRQSGPIELAYPEARRELARRYAEAVTRGGYDGLMFYTYVEHFALTFADEFGYSEPVVTEFKKRYGRDIRTESFDKHAWYRLRGEFVTQFLRELKAGLADHGKKLGVAIDPQDTHTPAPWLCDRAVHPAGRIHLDWERWVREKLVDEIMVYCNGDQEAAINDVLAVTEEAGCRVSAIQGPHGFPFHAQWRHFDRRGVKLVMGGANHQIEMGYPEAQPAEALGGSDPLAKLRVLQQVVEGKTSVTAAELAKAAAAPDVLVRRRAIAALAAQTPPAIEAIEEKLNDPEHSVRCAAADALGRCPGKHSVARLFAAVKAHGNFQFDTAAATALSRMRAEWTADVLGGLEEGDARVRRVAAAALRSGELRPESLPALKRALGDGDALVRFNAVAALARLPQAEATAALALALDDGDPTARSRAAVAIGARLTSKSCWLGPAQWKVFQRLEGLFGRCTIDSNAPDDAWSYRPIGNALLALGPRGKEALERFRAQNRDARLADFAWQVLHVPQNGYRYCSLVEAEALRNYEKHPRFSKPAVPRTVPEPARMTYLAQAFDGGKPSADGSLGEAIHDSGLWRTLRAAHPAPVLQEKVRHGERGGAVRLRRCEPGAPHTLSGVRTDYRIRDDAASVEFRVYRETPDASFAVMWKNTNRNEAYVGVFVKPGGKLAVMTRDRSWADTQAVLPEKSWQRIGLELDPAALEYSVRMGEQLETVVRQGIAFPAGLEWNSLLVSPQPPEGQSFCLDDVRVMVPNPAHNGKSAAAPAGGR